MGKTKTKHTTPATAEEATALEQEPLTATEIKERGLLLRRVYDVRSRRNELLSLKGTFREKMDEFMVKYGALDRAIKDSSAALAEEETALRDAAVAFHRRYGGDKQVAPAVKVVEKVTFDYPPDKALEWARKAEVCIIPEQLDVKMFEKMLPALKLPFVKEIKTPQAQLATNMDSALTTFESEVVVSPYRNGEAQ